MDITDAISETFSVDDDQSTALSDNISISDSLELGSSVNGAGQHQAIEMGRQSIHVHGRTVSNGSELQARSL